MTYFRKDNPYLEKLVDSYFSSIQDWFDREHVDGLTVLLLGSLSRGEGTWIEENGAIKLISDIEFFTVVSERFERKEEFDEFIQSEARRIFQPVATDLFHVDNSFVEKSSLAKLEKKLLTFDAIAFGKCVVGPNVMENLPNVNYDNINMRDIYDILIHRVFSVLYYGWPLKVAGLEQQYRYSIAKNSLDLMTVMLVERGELVSGFGERLKKITEKDIDEALKRYFAYCLSLKYSEEDTGEFSTSEMEQLFIDTVKRLDADFDVVPTNWTKNIKSLLRRCAGIVKRSLIVKRIPPRSFLRRLINVYETQSALSAEDLLDNYVLNGYPQPAQINGDGQ